MDDKDLVDIATADLLARAEAAEARCKEEKHNAEYWKKTAKNWESNWDSELKLRKAAEARAEQAERERDFLIKLIHGECWACVRRYDCNSRLGPHRKCWEFDQSILQVRQGNSTC